MNRNKLGHDKPICLRCDHSQTRVAITQASDQLRDDTDMLSQVLRRDVEAYAEQLRRRSPLLHQAKSGKLDAHAVCFYLEGLRYLTRESARLLSFAGECAERARQQGLAEYYHRKAGEERGHDRWAENDLIALSSDFSVNRPSNISLALRTLTQFLEREIEASPPRLLAYQLLAEHLTVLLGPEWVSALERHCGFKRAHLSVVQNHVELDEEHVDEGLSEIDTFTDPSELDAMRSTIRQASRYLDAFFAEVLEHSRAA